MERHKKPAVEPLLLTVPQASRALGISRHTLYRMIRRGELHPIHIGRATRISTAEVRRWVQAHDHNTGSR